MSRYTKGERQGAVIIVVIALVLTVGGFLLRGCGSGSIKNTFESVERHDTVIATNQADKQKREKKKRNNRKHNQRLRKKAKARKTSVETQQAQRDWLRDTIPS